MEYHLLADIIHKKATEYGTDEALRIRDHATKSWSSVSWNFFSEIITKTAQSLCHFGIKEESKVGIYSHNRAECLYIDFAVFSNRAISVPMYATSTASQITYIINEAEISLLFVGDQFQYDIAYEVMRKSEVLQQLVILDKLVQKVSDDAISIYFDEFTASSYQTTESKRLVAQRKSLANESDIVHLVYTSGTTGEPKGVILTQSNYIEALNIHNIRLGYLPPRFLSLSFLPQTHIFEKAWSIICLYWGCTIAINLDPREIQQTIKEVRPEGMCSVPRFWEKVYAGVQDKIEHSNPVAKFVFKDAIETGRKYCLNYRNKEKRAPWWLQCKFKLYDRTIFQLLKKTIGIENGIIFPCAGAALSDKINTFIQSVNIPLVYGYGLTETTATVACFPKTGFEIGTVGKVMPGTEIRIGEDNEIQIKSGTVMQGYFKKPKETAEAFTTDGWFRSGDAGQLTAENNIVLTERLKDLYKTSNGKYIAPQQLEIRLAEDRYIETCAVIADERKYVSALIVPDFVELKNYAKKQSIEFKNKQDLCDSLQIRSLFSTRIKELLTDFANYEQIKQFVLLPESFTIESGELTNTLKIKRSYVNEKYKLLIESMYSDRE